MTPVLTINQLTKRYGKTRVVHDLSLDLQQGQIGCLLGESGCGKTTVLRCVAGFEPIQSGTILLKGLCVSGNGENMPPEKRQIGMVFQDYALFPHLTVQENVGFGLSALSRKNRSRQIDRMLELVDLTGVVARYPHELSGGQQQRVALARALAPNPGLLLMDEPFSNLDASMRERLCMDVRTVLKKTGTTALLVTHSQQEAFAMADRIGVMTKGSLEQWDTAYNLYHRPKSRYVAGFIGEGTFLKGEVLSDKAVHTALGTLKGRFSSPCSSGCHADLLIRPDDIIHDDDSPLKARIIDKRFRGASILYCLETDTCERILALVSSHHDHDIGQTIGIRAGVDEIILFPTAETADAITVQTSRGKTIPSKQMESVYTPAQQDNRGQETQP